MQDQCEYVDYFVKKRLCIEVGHWAGLSLIAFQSRIPSFWPPGPRSYILMYIFTWNHLVILEEAANFDHEYDLLFCHNNVIIHFRGCFPPNRWKQTVPLAEEITGVAFNSQPGWYSIESLHRSRKQTTQGNIERCRCVCRRQGERMEGVRLNRYLPQISSLFCQALTDKYQLNPNTGSFNYRINVSQYRA